MKLDFQHTQQSTCSGQLATSKKGRNTLSKYQFEIQFRQWEHDI